MKDFYFLFFGKMQKAKFKNAEFFVFNRLTNSLIVVFQITGKSVTKSDKLVNKS